MSGTRGLGALGAVLLVGTVLTAAPAVAAPPSTTVTLSATPGTIDARQPVTLAGTVRAVDRTVGRAAVRLQMRQGSAWRAVRTVRTDDEGRFRHVVRPRAGTRFRAEVVASSRTRRAVSVTRTVRVRTATRIVLSTDRRLVDRGERVHLSVRATSGGTELARTRVDLQLRQGGRWRTVRTLTTDAAGRAEHVLAPSATLQVRARVAATTRRSDGTAGTTITVRPADAPALVRLSIGASVPAVDLGGNARVTGSVQARGRALDGVPVHLVDRGTGRAVATTTSSRGTFGFTVAPRRSTTYQVRTDAAPGREPGTSPTRTLGVRPLVAVASPSGTSLAVAGLEKHLTGRLEGVTAGHPVELQEGAAGRPWRTVARGTVDGSGGFELRYAPATPGTWTVRVAVPAARGLAAAHGPERRVVVSRSIEALTAASPRCFGAAALHDRSCRNPDLEGLVLPSRHAHELRLAQGGVYEEPCWRWDYTATVNRCRFGSTDPDAPRIALVGDSHANGYMTGLPLAAGRAGVRLDTYLGISCRWMSHPAGHRCRARADDITRRLTEGGYDLVVYTGVRQPVDRSLDVSLGISQQYSDVWKQVIDAGTKVVAVADFAFLEADSLTCLARTPASRAESCTVERSVAYGGTDPLFEAVRMTPGASMIDMTTYFCPGERCPLVAGGVVLYRDRHHLTGTYAATVAPYLMDEIREELPR